MSTKLAVFVCTIMIAFATSSWAGGSHGGGENARNRPQAAVPNNKLGCNGYVDSTGHVNLLKTMPSDACVVSATSVVNHSCDENGNLTNVNGRRTQQWVCIIFTTRNERFHAVYEIKGEMGASKIFLVAVLSEGRWTTRHELWSTGQNTAVTWMSGRASGLYDANGGDPNQVIAGGGSNTPTTQSAPQAKTDCSQLGFAQRILCEAKNNQAVENAIGTAVKGLRK